MSISFFKYKYKVLKQYQESEFSPEAYYLHEEEVPRSGAVLYQSFQRARWYNGKVVTWLGTRKQTGRGEGSSGLAFDRIVTAT